MYFYKENVHISIYFHVERKCNVFVNNEPLDVSITNIFLYIQLLFIHMDIGDEKFKYKLQIRINGHHITISCIYEIRIYIIYVHILKKSEENLEITYTNHNILLLGK